MINNIHPNQISLFDTLEYRGIFERERKARPRFFIRHTYQDIISVNNLLVSWQEFIHDKRKREDVAEFALHFMDSIMVLHRELKEKTYTHGSYEAFKINDPKPRDIHKAEVRDRLVHHALCRILYPFFDRKFIYDSYSCRVNKGTHGLSEKIKKCYDPARAIVRE